MSYTRNTGTLPARPESRNRSSTDAVTGRDSEPADRLNAAMDVPVDPRALQDPLPVQVHRPARQTAPVIFASPHSGRAYSADFLAAARLDPLSLRRSEDSFVDDLFAAAPDFGAPLIAATFPRAFCDVNREPWELDPAMFADRLPAWVNTTSARVGAGLGTIARVVASGEAIYRGKLPFAEAERRVQTCWQPYHDTLSRDDRRRPGAMFGFCLLIDCHSMPSNGQPAAAGARMADFILGDAHGTACTPCVTRFVEKVLSDQGYRGAAQRPICRRVHHPPLRPPAPEGACAADRDRPRPVYGRGAHRAAARRSTLSSGTSRC